MDTIKELEKKHREEIDRFVKDCPHTDIEVLDNIVGFKHRSIVIRCKRCRLPLLGYEVDNSLSYMSFVEDCVKGHPGSRTGWKTAKKEETI